MPATSKAQRQAAGIAEHEPSKLFKRNRGLLSMKRKDLRHFSTTRERGLPERKIKSSR